MRDFIKKTAISFAFIVVFGFAFTITSGCNCEKGDEEEDEVTTTQTVTETTQATTEATTEALSEYDQFREALNEESGIELPENPSTEVSEFWNETFDEGDTVVAAHFTADQKFVDDAAIAITKVMGEPVQSENGEDYQFIVWSQPGSKPNTVNELVLDVAPDGNVGIKYHKDLSTDY
ncbi:MAG: hypothetical protein IJT72_01565 [Lachnospiraceae bacterium]|nr:hypothetical protein [Lachnospiraceae bacterium]